MTQKPAEEKPLHKVHNILRHLVVKFQVFSLPPGLQSLCVCVRLPFCSVQLQTV